VVGSDGREREREREGAKESEEERVRERERERGREGELPACRTKMGTVERRGNKKGGDFADSATIQPRRREELPQKIAQHCVDELPSKERVKE